MQDFPGLSRSSDHPAQYQNSPQETVVSSISLNVPLTCQKYVNDPDLTLGVIPLKHLITHFFLISSSVAKDSALNLLKFDLNIFANSRSKGWF